MEKAFELLVTYAEDRQDFVAEIWLHNRPIAELYRDQQQTKCLALLCPGMQEVDLPLEDFQAILQAANDKLWPSSRAQ
jgi:hypothetical protein